MIRISRSHALGTIPTTLPSRPARLSGFTHTKRSSDQPTAPSGWFRGFREFVASLWAEWRADWRAFICEDISWHPLGCDCGDCPVGEVWCGDCRAEDVLSCDCQIGQ